MSVEIRLKAKYRVGGRARRGSRGNYNGNNRPSFGKHSPHPDIHGFKVRGYRCEPKWNPRVA